jgi:CRISPR-associated endoribonuclease Cas6
VELQLKLKILQGNRLPANYQYLLSSWIYKVIRRADEQYSSFLHEKGFVADGKTFKMFTFSQLDLRPYEINGPLIYLLGKDVSLNVRFLVDKSLEHFITGLFMEQRFWLGDKSYIVDFEVSSMETLAPPQFNTTMHYQCLSPICVSRVRPDQSAEYQTPQDAQYGYKLLQNLQRKAKALASTLPDEIDIKAAFNFKLLNTPRKKGIHIKTDTAHHTQVIGYLFHFEFTAPVELHEIGYYAGFGEKNSMGFGTVIRRIEGLPG